MRGMIAVLGAAWAVAGCDLEEDGVGPAPQSLRLEVSDSRDPAPVDAEVTYTIEVFNGGSSARTNIRLSAAVPPELVVTATHGPTARADQDGGVTFRPLERLGPGERAVWTVSARGREASELRVRVRLESDQRREAAVEEEPTRFIP